MSLSGAVLKITVAIEDFTRAVQAATDGFRVLHSAVIIARYPWNPLGTRDYFAHGRTRKAGV